MQSMAEMDFKQRVSPRLLPERMDGDCSYEEFLGCLRGLEQINRLFLGYRPTLTWLNRLATGVHAPLEIIDVGCGGGDLLRRIALWARKRGMAVRLTGIDLSPHGARVATESTPSEFNIKWVVGNALVYRHENPIDVVVSSLVTHHLEDEEIITLLQWMEKTANVGWFINDLERSKRTSRLFACVAAVAGWHPFVRHDGPVSFRRAFRKEDWVRLLAAAEVPRDAVTIESWRPGRLCVGRWK
jgi:2-polyprenyl-3-methyl-5-hydroxy-6-metoxy-1,4-benzoquinol methylase